MTRSAKFPSGYPLINSYPIQKVGWVKKDLQMKTHKNGARGKFIFSLKKLCFGLI